MAESDKARLYRRIVQQSDEHTILDEMRERGFWPAQEGLPQDPLEEAAEREKIETELVQLRRKAYSVKNPEKELSKERKRRWDESKKRRAAAKKQKEQAREQRREAWQAYKTDHVVHLGIGVSAGLQKTTSDVEALNQRDLPVMHNSTDLAARLGIKLSALRWLGYHRKGATLVHYQRFSIAKKTGGMRYISAPKPALAHVQSWILENILKRLQMEPCAHGFIAKRSVVSNASPHANKAVVINLDIKDFFPSITFRRVKGLFHALGYSEHVATVLALLCTEPPRIAAQVDGKIYYVALGARVLPQGACTSPAITNALCRRLDRRLFGLARRHDFSYTRYADDLTFSGDKPAVVGRLLRSIRNILQLEGFTEHPRKTRVMRRAVRQEVTGLTVNRRPSVSRRELRQLRAILHNCAMHGLESQNRDGRPNFSSYLRGKVEYVCMVNPGQAGTFRRALAAALAGPQ